MLQRVGVPARGGPRGAPEQRDPPRESPAVVGTVASVARGPWDVQVEATTVVTRAPQEEMDLLLAQREEVRPARSGFGATSGSASWMTTTQMGVFLCQHHRPPYGQSRGSLRLKSPASPMMTTTKPVDCQYCCCPPVGRQRKACAGGEDASASGIPSAGEKGEGSKQSPFLFPMWMRQQMRNQRRHQ